MYNMGRCSTRSGEAYLDAYSVTSPHGEGPSIKHIANPLVREIPASYGIGGCSPHNLLS